jgi:REP element-mobilizing transposase RayT
MGQSFCNLLYHVVFSTKDRAPLLNANLRTELNDYVGGIVRGLGGVPLALGGTEDHLHIFARLRQDKAIADMIRDIKAGSSGWIHKKRLDLSHFGWQAGYGAFTVSGSQIDRLQKYVLGQTEHHQKQDFKQEFIALLTAHGIDYDDRYIWS